MTDYRENILQLFREAYLKDKKFIKKWMVNWEYHDKRINRGVKYSDELPQEYYDYTGPKEITKWMNWIKGAKKPHFFDQKMVDDLSRKSRAYDEKLMSQFKLQYDFSDYNQFIGNYNAQDYILANAYPMQRPQTGERILDFGAGYGRQVNLWSQNGDEKQVYIGMDAIPKSYCLQHLYYSQADKPFFEYAANPDMQKLNAESNGVYHLPTWRFDLIPDNYLDVVLVIQVLPELNADLVKYSIRQFKRVLKDTGILLIRDHDLQWRPGHTLNTNKVLQEEGFVLEYHPHVKDKVDLHGIPRIWRKRNKDIQRQLKISLRQRMDEWIINFDSRTKGKVKKTLKKILGK